MPDKVLTISDDNQINPRALEAIAASPQLSDTYGEQIATEGTLARAAVETVIGAESVLRSINVAFDGDSQTAGTNNRFGQSYPAQVARTLSAQTRFAGNVAVGGQGVDGMITRGAANVDPLIDPTAKRNILIAWGGTNDLYSANTAGGVQARIQNYCEARRAAGWEVYWLTILPRTQAGIAADYETKRQAVNTWLRAQAGGAFLAGVIDVAADSRIGDAGDELSTLYYRSDTIHLNNNGSAIVAALVRARLAQIGALSNYAKPAELWIPASAMRGYQGSPDAGTINRGSWLLFDPDTQESAAASIRLPLGLTPCRVELFWSAQLTGDVVWQVFSAEFEEGATVAPSANLLQQIANSPVGNTLVKTVMSTSWDLDPTKFFGLHVSRNAPSGSDTLTVDARLLGVLLTPVTLV